MNVYTHTLTPLEIALRVTLEDVARELPRGLFTDNGQAFTTADVSPALAMSVARCAFGAPARFVGLNAAGLPVYRAAVEV